MPHSQPKHGTKLHAALTDAATSPSKRMSVVATRRQSVAKAREDLLSATTGAAVGGMHGAVVGSSPAVNSDVKRPFSRDMQPLINSRFSLVSDGQAASSERTVCSKAVGSLVACDKACAAVCGGQRRRKQLRETVVLHKYFDTFILVVIAANAICLAADSPLLDENSRSARALRIFDVIFTIIFVVEAVLKIAALGCFARYDVSTEGEPAAASPARTDAAPVNSDTEQGSPSPTATEAAPADADDDEDIARRPYCLSGWNKLDFLIVVVGLLEFIPSIGGGSSALRALRVLRPLRAVNKLRSLRVIVTTLFNTLPDLAQVAIVLTFMFVIFGIMGLQLFNGALRNRCVDTASGELLEDGEYICSPEPSGGARACPATATCLAVGDNLGNGVVNFDDIGHALLAVYLIADMSGWAEMMYGVQDAVGKAVWIYFTLIIITISFFAMNLVLAVVVQEFETVSKDEDELQDLAAEEAALQKELAARDDTKQQGAAPKRAPSVPLLVDEEHAGSPERAVDGTLVALKLQSTAGSLSVYEFRGPEDFSPTQDTTATRSSAAREGGATLAPPFKSTLAYRQRMGSGELHSYAADLASGKATIHMYVGAEESSQAQLPPGAMGNGPNAVSGAADWQRASGVPSDTVGQPSAATRFVDLAGVEPEIAADGHLKHIATQSGIRLFEFSSLSQAGLGSDGSGGTSLPGAGDVLHATQTNTPEEYISRVLQRGPSDDVVDVAIAKMLATLSSTETDAGAAKPSAVPEETPRLVSADKIAARDMLRAADKVIQREEQWLKDKPEWLHSIFGLVSSSPFKVAVNVAIIVNTVVLAIDHHGISESQASALDAANLFFTVFFLGEVVLKLLALGPSTFVRDAFNLFDAAVVLASIIELGVASGGGVISVLRSLRLVRLLRLLKQFSSLRVLLSTVAQSIPDVSWMALLMALFVFIFAVLGQQLLAGKLAGLDDPPVFTFETFGDSLLTSITILSNDDWDEIMFDGVRCCGEGVVAFFLIGQMLGMYIILSLFIAILLRRFSEQDDGAFDAEDLSEFVLALRQDQLKASLRRGGGGEDTGVIAATALRAQVLRIERAKVRRQQKAAHNHRVPQGMAGFSCGLAPPDAPLRVLLYRIVTSSVFEFAIFALILLNCVFLALDRPTLDADSQLARAIRGMDFFFAFVFLFEMVAKMIAHGLWLEDGRGYFRNSWNILDSVVVIISFVSLGFPQVAVARALRALRPLRLVVRSKNIQVVVNALIAALPGMANVILLASVIWTIFAIMGTNLFKGGFYSCSDEQFDSRADCEAASSVNNTVAWQPIEGTEFANFDHVGNSMLLLFQVATLSGWGQLMHATIAVRGEDLAPQAGSNPAASLYFIAFVVIGGFFMINLAVGVVIDNFNRLKALYDGSAFLTQAQQRYYYAKKIVFAAQTQLTTLLDRPRAQWRHRFHSIATSSSFEKLIFSCIILNTFLMMSQHYQQPDSLTTVLFVFNILFVLVFTVEAAVKIIGVRGGALTYWKDNWNKFDALVLLLSYVSLFSDSGTGASVIRVFRVVRVFRLIKSAPTLRKLTQTLLLSAPSLLNIGALLAVMFFMLSVLGVSLFGDILPKDDSALNRHANFVDFGDSLELTWRISTGDAWEMPMYAAMAEKGGGAAIFFVAVQLVLSFVFLQLFIAVILEQFGEDLEARIEGGGFEEHDDSENQEKNTQGHQFSIPPDGVNGFAPPGWTPMMSLQAWANTWNTLDTLATKNIKASLFGVLMQGVAPPFGFGTSQLSQLEVLQRCQVFNIPIFLVDAALVKRQKTDASPGGARPTLPRQNSTVQSASFFRQCKRLLVPQGTEPATPDRVPATQASASAAKPAGQLRPGVESRAGRSNLEWCMKFEPTLLALAQVALRIDVSQDDESSTKSSWALHEYIAVANIESWWAKHAHAVGELSFKQRARVMDHMQPAMVRSGEHMQPAMVRSGEQAFLHTPELGVGRQDDNRSAKRSPSLLPKRTANGKQQVSERQRIENPEGTRASSPEQPQPPRGPTSLNLARVTETRNPLLHPAAAPKQITHDARQSTSPKQFGRAAAKLAIDSDIVRSSSQVPASASPRRLRASRALQKARLVLPTADAAASEAGAQSAELSAPGGSPHAGILPSRQLKLTPASAVRIKLALRKRG